MPYLIFNNDLLPSDEFKISPINRGALYGDGYFETLISVDGKLMYFDAHYERFVAAANACGLILPSHMTAINLKNQIINLLEANNAVGIQRIRITCWRGGQGLYSPETDGMEYLITIQLGRPAAEVKSNIKIFEDMYKPYSVLSFCKTLSANIYVMAARKKMLWNVDDVIILGEKKTIAECSASNIFLINKNIVYTPYLMSGCIAGIMRNQIKDWCIDKQIMLVEKEITIIELMEAEAIFTANVTGISAVAKIENTAFNISHPFLLQIQQKFNLTRQ